MRSAIPEKRATKECKRAHREQERRIDLEEEEEVRRSPAGEEERRSLVLGEVGRLAEIRALAGA